MNVGTIVESDMLKVRLVRSRNIRRRPYRRGRARRPRARPDRGIFHRTARAWRHLRVRRRDPEIRGAGRRTRSTFRAPIGTGRQGSLLRGRQIPALDLPRRARARAARRYRARGSACRRRCASGSRSRNGVRSIPPAGDLLIETFARASRYYLVCYPFEGRLAHQTLGMLLTRRLERARLRPLGFVANEYALAIWCVGDIALRISRGELDPRGAVRRGHAGRRSRSLARRIRR